MYPLVMANHHHIFLNDMMCLGLRNTAGWNELDAHSFSGHLHASPRGWKHAGATMSRSLPKRGTYSGLSAPRPHSTFPLHFDCPLLCLDLRASVVSLRPGTPPPPVVGKARSSPPS